MSPDLKEPLWLKVRGYVLWIVSFAIGVLALFAAWETVRIITPVVVPLDPMHTTEYLGQTRLISIISFFALGITWLVWYILLIERYTKAKSAGILAKQFGITTLIQAIIFGLYYIAPTVVRWLA
jgi:hypothetical protein